MGFEDTPYQPDEGSDFDREEDLKRLREQIREEMTDERLPDIERTVTDAVEKNFGPEIEHIRSISPWGPDRPVTIEAVRLTKESKNVIVSLGHLAEIEDMDEIGTARADAGVLWDEKILTTLDSWSTDPPIHTEQTDDPILAMERETAAVKEADASAKKLARMFAEILRGTLMQIGVRDASERYHEIMREELKRLTPEVSEEKLDHAIERAKQRIIEEYRQ